LYFIYGSFVASSDTGCITSGWYHGGMNMCGSSVGHPKGPTCGLNSGSLGESPPGEFPLSESLGCVPFDGWSEPLDVSW
jgi:hypothetical protein